MDEAGVFQFAVNVAVGAVKNNTEPRCRSVFAVVVQTLEITT